MNQRKNEREGNCERNNRKKFQVVKTKTETASHVLSKINKKVILFRFIRMKI